MKKKSRDSKKVSKRHKRVGNDDDLFEEFETRTFTSSHTVLFSAAGLILTALPAYLFQGVYDLTLLEYGLAYLLVTGLATVLMSISYRNIAVSTFASLQGARKFASYNRSKDKDKDKDAPKTASETQEELSERESVAWSLLQNNITFLVTWFFLAFYVLRGFQALYVYVISVVLAAAAVWQLSILLTTPSTPSTHTSPLLPALPSLPSFSRADKNKTKNKNKTD